VVLASEKTNRGTHKHVERGRTAAAAAKTLPAASVRRQQECYNTVSFDTTNYAPVRRPPAAHPWKPVAARQQQFSQPPCSRRPLARVWRSCGRWRSRHSIAHNIICSNSGSIVHDRSAATKPGPSPAPTCRHDKADDDDDDERVLESHARTRAPHHYLYRASTAGFWRARSQCFFKPGVWWRRQPQSAQPASSATIAMAAPWRRRRWRQQ
jgi:hypothetical protein